MWDQLISKSISLLQICSKREGKGEEGKGKPGLSPRSSGSEEEGGRKRKGEIPGGVSGEREAKKKKGGGGYSSGATSTSGKEKGGGGWRCFCWGPQSQPKKRRGEEAVLSKALLNYLIKDKRGGERGSFRFPPRDGGSFFFSSHQP